MISRFVNTNTPCYSQFSLYNKKSFIHKPANTAIQGWEK